ncbi:MAG: hypothetical protein DRH24_06560 [Deltaproteobacteria bacterium]|nr:MAG: hypothetical protein DRH24_06560 [Deltaproteobacteria bacterium]HGY10804.1 hypothetical protein [Desulfobacterales bacterium]
MLHKGLQKEIIKELCTINKNIVDVLEKDDLDAIKSLSEKYQRAMKCLTDSGPITDPDQHQPVSDLNKIILRTCKLLEEKKNQILNRLIKTDKAKKCANAYENNVSGGR